MQSLPEHLGRLRPLDRQECHLLAGVAQGDAEALRMPRNVREVLLRVARVDHHHHTIGEAVHERVVLDRAALIEDRRVVHLPHRQRGHVVRGYMVHEVHRAVAGHPELTHVGDVEHPHPFSHRLVLGRDAGGILHGHLVAGERDDLGTERGVDVVEGGALERRGSSGGGHGFSGANEKYALLARRYARVTGRCVGGACGDDGSAGTFAR